MADASLAQWLERLESLHPKSMDLGLERVASVARTLSLLPVVAPVITVAGTNGKGSVVAVLEALLERCGRTTGVYTSPHLLRFNERIRVGGSEVGDAEIISAFETIDAARGDTSLTYFEFATLAALLVFAARKADVLVLEVGLGGRLDAVNIVDPQVAVITAIDLDHQAWLGETREAIALEKAGILRRDRPVVIADPAPPPALAARAAEVGASPVLQLGEAFSVETSGQSWCGTLWLGPGEDRRLPPQPVGPLLPANICAALQAVVLLGQTFSDEQLQGATGAAHPRGRRELVRENGREYLLDVAHNPAAVDKMLEYIHSKPCKGRTIGLFSAMADKDIPGMLRLAAGHIEAWFLADQPGNGRAARAADIAAMLREQGQGMISVSKNLRQAFRRAQGLMGPDDRLLVFGSFSTVAGVLPLLEKDRRRSSASVLSR